MRFLSSIAMLTVLLSVVAFAPFPAFAAEFGDKCVVAAGSCGEFLWCDPNPGRCTANAVGYGNCATAPQICAQIYAPVCGCDGKTYSNGCTLRAAKIGLNHMGECKPGETDQMAPRG